MENNYIQFKSALTFAEVQLNEVETQVMKNLPMQWLEQGQRLLMDLPPEWLQQWWLSHDNTLKTVRVLSSVHAICSSMRTSTLGQWQLHTVHSNNNDKRSRGFKSAFVIGSLMGNGQGIGIEHVVWCGIFCFSGVNGNWLVKVLQWVHYRKYCTRAQLRG